MAFAGWGDGAVLRVSPAIGQESVGTLIAPGNQDTIGEQAASDETSPETDATPDGAESTKVPKLTLEDLARLQDLPPGVEELEIELSDEQRELVREFVARRKVWADTLVEMRALEIRYSNGDDRSNQSLERFFELRDRARSELRELFAAGVKLFQGLPNDGESGSFLVTALDYYREQSVYEDTYPAVRALLDLEVPMPFLTLVGARSAFLEGRFDEVMPLYQAFVDEHGFDKLEDIDQQLASMLSVYPEWWEQELAARESQADDLPRVRLDTTRGPIVIELFEDTAPNTVANFIKLVEDGFYDESEFYQVISDLLAIGGDPVGDGSGTMGKFLPDEHDRPDARRIFRGSIFMAKMPDGTQQGQFVPNSASCQFVIALMPMAPRELSQTVFGRVIEGMDVIGSFRRVDPSKKKEGVVLPPDRILGGKVLRKRDHDYSVRYIER